MKNVNKKFLKVFIILISMFLNITLVLADGINDNNFGQPSNYSPTGHGGYASSYVGLKIFVYDRNYDVIKSGIITSRDFSGKCTRLVNKFAETGSYFAYDTCTGMKVVDYLPSKWEEILNSSTMNLQKYLSQNDFEKLKLALGSIGADDLNSAMYIVVEPLFVISGVKYDKDVCTYGKNVETDSDARKLRKESYSCTSKTNKDGIDYYECIKANDTYEVDQGQNCKAGYIKTTWSTGYHWEGGAYYLTPYEYLNLDNTEFRQYFNCRSAGTGQTWNSVDSCYHATKYLGRSLQVINEFKNTITSPYNTYLYTSSKEYPKSSTLGSCSANESYCNICVKDQNGGCAIGWYNYSEVVQAIDGYLQIYKKNSSNKLITVTNQADAAQFNIYNNASCTGDPYKTITIKNVGYSDKIQLPVGQYYVQESRAPKGYALNSTCFPVTISATNEINNPYKLEVANYNGCQYEVDNNIYNRISLYQDKYNSLNNLLNFTNTTNPCSTLSAITTYNIGCLSGSVENKMFPSLTGTYASFNKDNLSAYTFARVLDDGSATAYCASTIVFNNILPVNLSSKSGQLYLKRDTADYLSANLKIKCYAYDSDSKLISGKLNVGNVSNFLSDVKLGSAGALEYMDSPIEVTLGTEKVVRISYKLKGVYAKNGTGEVVYNSCSNCKFLGYGLASKLTDSGSNNYEFSFSYNLKGQGTKNTVSKQCTYTADPEIVQKLGSTSDLQVLARSLQTINAFPGQSGEGRDSGSNWDINSLDIDGDKKFTSNDAPYLLSNIDKYTYNTKYDLNNDGIVTSTDAIILLSMHGNPNKYNYKKMILEDRPNSYGIIPSTGERKEAKYVIELDSNSIDIIRTYNSSNRYDDYTLSCLHNGEVCISTYLDKLVEKGILTINYSSRRDNYKELKKAS